MFRQVSTAALLVFVALASLALATAEKPKAAGSQKQIAVDLGKGVKLEMVLVPAGGSA